MANVALIVIDMQNEFLHPTLGRYNQKNQPVDTLVNNVLKQIYLSRQHKELVIFIKAVYLDTIQSSKDTHNTRQGNNPCCAEGSLNSHLFDSIESEIQDNDILIIKHYYSAFQNTDLYERLQEHNITHIKIIGVNTNVCVYRTVIDGIRLGFQVEIVENACAASNFTKHERALKDLRLQNQVTITIV